MCVLLFHTVVEGGHSPDNIDHLIDIEVDSILKGLKKVNQFSDKKSAVESENYIKLLLSIAEDIRVVFIMIAQQLQRMRDAKEREPSHRLDLSVESTYLYAPLAHRLVSML